MNAPKVILFGSVTGNARYCAREIAARLAREGHAAVAALDLAGYEPSRILHEETALICISTWGDGEPPDDAAAFVEFLGLLKAGALARLRFSVLALGDSGYPAFCRCGRNLDALLESLGAKRIAPRVDCDVEVEEGLRLWSDAVSAALASSDGRSRAA